MGLGLTLTNNEIEDIMKIVRSLRNRDNLVKGTAERIKSQERGFLGNALGSLMKVGLSLIKSDLTLSAKGVLILLGLTTTTAAPASDAAI